MEAASAGPEAACPGTTILRPTASWVALSSIQTDETSGATEPRTE